jgi:hypothetical protein
LKNKKKEEEARNKNISANAPSFSDYILPFDSSSVRYEKEEYRTNICKVLGRNILLFHRYMSETFPLLVAPYIIYRLSLPFY